MSIASSAIFAIKGLWTFYIFIKMVFIIVAVTSVIQFIRDVPVVMRRVLLSRNSDVKVCTDKTCLLNVSQERIVGTLDYQ